MRLPADRFLFLHWRRRRQVALDPRRQPDAQPGPRSSPQSEKSPNDDDQASGDKGGECLSPGREEQPQSTNFIFTVMKAVSQMRGRNHE